MADAQPSATDSKENNALLQARLGVRAAGPALRVEAPALQWGKCKAKVAWFGCWGKLVSYCLQVGIPGGQAKRNYLLGPKSWRLGPGAGKRLVVKKDFDTKSGSRGGVPATYVQAAVLEQVFYKYHAKKGR